MPVFRESPAFFRESGAWDASRAAPCYHAAMLRLLLLRHSKAGPHARTRDHERALIERGRDDAARIGAHIAAHGMAPKEAVHSGSKRTKETLDIAVKAMKKAIPVSVDPRLYEATADGFLEVVRSHPGKADPLLIVGHNPSMAEAARRLAATGDGVAMMRMAAKFPTSGLAIVDFDVDRWAEVEERAGRLVDFVTPAALGGRDD
jgi:phosphohistidine phosphatase